MTDLETILSWFQTGDMPTEEEFQASWSSFWHKEESIPTSKITGLDNQLQNKADKNVFETHVSNNDSHTNYLARKDASNLNDNNVQAWKTTLGVAESIAWSDWINIPLNAPATANTCRYRKKGDRVQIDIIALRHYGLGMNNLFYLPAEVKPSFDMYFTGPNVSQSKIFGMSIVSTNGACYLTTYEADDDALFATLDYTI